MVFAGIILIPVVVINTMLLVVVLPPKTNVEIKGDFPDPFVFNNGTAVETVQDWQVRRDEIKEMILDIQYGRPPGRPDALNVTHVSSETRPDGSSFSTVILTVVPSNTTPSSSFNFTLDLYVPPGIGPFPTIVKVSKDGTGSQEPNNSTITSKGYIYACYHHTDLDPDESGIVGVAQAAYPSYDWATLMVWAWGAMRVADYLLEEPWVSAPGGVPHVKDDALIVCGHSRRGKTALIAAAFDDRFDMVDCNGGCAGGAGSYLVLGPGAESLKDITAQNRFHYWFHENFSTYAGREDELPFDQHYMRALVAPRIMLTTDGIDDEWANPIGVQAVYEAAQPVFDFLNESQHNAIHYRPGDHGYLDEDFSTLLNLSSRFLLGNASATGDFYMTPFDIDFPIPYEPPA